MLQTVFPARILKSSAPRFHIQQALAAYNRCNCSYLSSHPSQPRHRLNAASKTFGAVPMAHTRFPTFFLSHGGGPWPYMKDEWGNIFDNLEASLKRIVEQLPQRPKAILVISGHFITQEFTVTSSAHPGMEYDYFGFPEHTYKIKYAAPGSPELAERVKGLVEAAGFPARLDSNRGFDHGTFSMLYPMYPQADVPVVQLSVRRDFDPEAHIKLGQALAPLRSEGILIIGSGFSFHNLRLMWQPSAKDASREFDDWLQESLKLEPQQRVQRLKEWTKAPSARTAHPVGGEDHLIPLMVAVGAAETEQCTCVYHEATLWGNVTASSFQFGQ